MNKVTTSIPTADLKPPKVKAVKPRGPGGRLLPGYGALNPHGRPPGSRTRLGEKFLKDLHDLYERKGLAILERAAEENPTAFFQGLIKLLPAEVLSRIEVSTNATLEIGIAQKKRIAESWILSDEDKRDDE